MEGIVFIVISGWMANVLVIVMTRGLTSSKKMKGSNPKHCSAGKKMLLIDISVRHHRQLKSVSLSKKFNRSNTRRWRMVEKYSLSMDGLLLARVLSAPVDISFRDECVELMYEFCRKKGTREVILEQDFMDLANMIMDFKAKYDKAIKLVTN